MSDRERGRERPMGQVELERDFFEGMMRIEPRPLRPGKAKGEKLLQTCRRCR